MTKIETLKDLMIAGEVTRGDVERLAEILFNGNLEDGLMIEGYDVCLPLFRDLPEREQSYLVKVFLECPVQNILERKVEDKVDIETRSTVPLRMPREDLGPENVELDSELLD